MLKFIIKHREDILSMLCVVGLSVGGMLIGLAKMLGY